MIEIKIAVVILCMACKLIGEVWWHNAQRWIMPAILGVGISLVTGVWWLGILVYPVCGPLDLGYDVYGKWSDGFDRAMWMFMICVVAGLACAIFGHLSWYFYVPYCILGAVWGGVTRLWWNVIIAPLSGALIGSIIFLVH